jgi:hypothetical protein
MVGVEVKEGNILVNAKENVMPAKRKFRRGCYFQAFHHIERAINLPCDPASVQNTLLGMRHFHAYDHS